jgi:hypothetical protein
MPIQEVTWIGINPCTMTTYNLFYIPSLDTLRNPDYIASSMQCVTAAAAFTNTIFSALTVTGL